MTIVLFLNRKEAAKACGVSVDTIARAQAQGKLKAKKTAERGGKHLYTLEDLKAWHASLDDA